MIETSRLSLKWSLIFLFCVFLSLTNAQDNFLTTSQGNYRDPRVREFIYPTRIIWSTQNSDSSRLINPQRLITVKEKQITLLNGDYCTMISKGKSPSLLLDFGKEIYGGLQIMLGKIEGKQPAKFRIRFGESVQEAMSEIGGAANATNDHSARDFVQEVPWVGSMEFGNTGFRFARIDLLDLNRTVPIIGIRAIKVFRDIEYKGSFESSDTLLNKIWMTGAYTVHLCMQDYLWDGIKRDRIVWIGDMHPEAMSILSVFGADPLVEQSLDFAKNTTPLPKWINGIGAYSIWWLIIQHDWYMHTGNIKYLESNKEYICRLLNQLMKYVGEKGEEKLPPRRFLDWPSEGNDQAKHAGLHSLLIKAFQVGAVLCNALDEKNLEQECADTIKKMKTYKPDPGISKQAAALMAIVGLDDAKKLNKKILSVDGAHRLSAFYGYYVLQARALADDYQGCLDVIKDYWGGMIKMGATTFWEDFDIDWMKNTSRIDELTEPGKKDIHGDFGNYCYVGFRHSFCHGWSSGPTAWLTEHVLGIKIVEPGYRKIKIEPQLGNLKWVKGKVPTPYGIIEVSYKRLNDNSIQKEYQLPKGISLVN